MDSVDGITVARLFHYLGDLFTELAVNDDPLVAEALAEQAVDAIRAIDELLGSDESHVMVAARERARWQ
jgi:HD-like signal output (HDOD) protein